MPIKGSQYREGDYREYEILYHIDRRIELMREEQLRGIELSLAQTHCRAEGAELELQALKDAILNGTLEIGCDKCANKGMLFGCQRVRKGRLEYYTRYCDCPTGQQMKKDKVNG